MHWYPFMAEDFRRKNTFTGPCACPRPAQEPTYSGVKKQVKHYGVATTPAGPGQFVRAELSGVALRTPAGKLWEKAGRERSPGADKKKTPPGAGGVG